MIKVKNIFVNGYKNLIKCSADLGDFTVLVGPNNSGKSNFLEIFSFVRGLIYGSEDLRKSIFEQGSCPRGLSCVCNIDKKKPKKIDISFLIEESENGKRFSEITYFLSVKCSSVLYKTKDDVETGFINEELTFKEKSQKGRAASLFKREGNLLRVRTESGNTSTKKIESTESSLRAVKTLFPNFENLDHSFGRAYNALMLILGVEVFAGSSDGLREDLYEEKKRPFYKIDRVTSFGIIPSIAKIHKDKKLFQHFKSVLCQIMDLEDARLLRIEVPEELRKESKDLPKIFELFQLKSHGQPYSELSSFSDGTLLVIAILIMLLSPDRPSPFICIEEPENCLHPKALKTLISYLVQRSKETQILITTHSPYLLNKINPADVIVSYLRDDGTASFDRVPNLRKLYKQLAKDFISFGDFLETDFKEDHEPHEVSR